MSKIDLQTTGTAIVALSVLGACVSAAPPRAHFVSLDEQGAVIATIVLQQPLPPHDTSLTFTGPFASDQHVTSVEPMKFKVAGAFQCHSTPLITICQTNEQNPAPARVEGGGYVRRLDEETILVTDQPGGSAGDFATFSNGRLIAFGVRNEGGKEPWRYDFR